MSIIESSFIETNEKYREGVALDEYNGSFSLTLCQRGNDEKIYPRWAKLQVGKDKLAEKATPVKIGLGDKDKAVDAMTFMIAVLNGTAVSSHPEDGSIPF